MSGRRAEYGDFQTPADLADAVCARAHALGARPRTVVEPTCGAGSLLVAAGRRFPDARLAGWDLAPGHLATARAALDRAGLAPRATLTEADFFRVDWAALAATWEPPVLVLGNPPWVTSAGVGALGGTNRPPRTNPLGLRGLDAVSGRSNFDISEWMLLRLLDALGGRDAHVAVLCKAAVARRVLGYVAARARPLACRGFWAVDARRHFAASVAAGLLVLAPQDRLTTNDCPVYPALDAPAPARTWGVRGGAVVADAAAWEATAWLEGANAPAWRSGLKHDCAAVMELARDGGGYVNGLGERVALEDEYVLPLLKGVDLARGLEVPARWVLVPQRRTGEDTGAIAARAPRTWAYLARHAERLARRASRVYAGRPPFSVFGVGPYAFAPWKVAVAGLHPGARFRVVGPHEGRPVLFDDTSYFLPLDDAPAAHRVAALLARDEARAFLAARTFPDAKRPLTKDLLQRLDLARLEGQFPATRATSPTPSDTDAP